MQYSFLIYHSPLTSRETYEFHLGGQTNRPFGENPIKSGMLLISKTWHHYFFLYFSKSPKWIEILIVEGFGSVFHPLNGIKKVKAMRPFSITHHWMHIESI